MLTIGEFSNICKVSAKTLRYYDEIGLLSPIMVNPENGYRYYTVEQLETMLLINRLKAYSFSLDEIKEILSTDIQHDDRLHLAFLRKRNELTQHLQDCERILLQLDDDIASIERGRSIMSFLRQIDVTLVDVPTMYLLSIRKKVLPEEYPTEYAKCFGALFQRIASENISMAAPPMVLYHSAEFAPSGLDTEFAIPTQNPIQETREFCPGLCLKTIVHGSYRELSAVYAKHSQWAEVNGYCRSDALYEVYVTDPSQVVKEDDNITEVYSPVRKIRSLRKE